MTALRLMVGCSDRYPMQFALRSGRIGGGGGGAPSSQCKVFQRCKFSGQEDGSPGFYDIYVQEAGEGADVG